MTAQSTLWPLGGCTGNTILLTKARRWRVEESTVVEELETLAVTAHLSICHFIHDNFPNPLELLKHIID